MSDIIQEGLDFAGQSAQYGYEKEMYERNRAVYEKGLETWKILNDSKADQEKQFDKNAMAVAAGSFGVSFAFIDTVVPLASAVYLPVLVSAWALFGVCILVMLIGYRISSIIHRDMCEEEKQNTENMYENKPVSYKERSNFFNLPEICNNLALITNAGGIICLILFVFLNFLKS